MAYAYQATVTIPAPTGGPHTDFTVVIVGTRTEMATVPNGGAVRNTVTRVGMTVPADLIVSTDVAGTSLLSWGFEKYVATTGEVIIWAKISSYSAGTTLYISVGNSAVSTYQGGAQGAEFDSNTVLVLHLPDGTTLSGKDFSASSIDFTASAGASAASGQIDGGVSMNGTTNAFASASGTLNSTPMVMTFSCWAKLSATLSGTRYTLFSTTNANTSGNWSVEFSGAIAPNVNSFTVIAPGAFIASTPANSVNNGSWYHVAFTRNGTGSTFALYINGVPQTLTYQTVVDFVDSGQPKNIGQRGTSNQLWNGLLDEIVYSKTPRSSNWIATMYANQSSPPIIGTFAQIISWVPNGICLMGCQ